MSRNIVENGNSVWRYRQGQEDPMAFISLVHNIGEYRILEINNESILPMKYFTQLPSPSEKTLELIRKIAYSYRTIKLTDGTYVPLCIN